MNNVWYIFCNFVANNWKKAMSVVQILDKKFKTSIPAPEIKERVKAVAERINNDLKDKNPLFLAVLNGSFIFAADLMREITIPCEISFVKLASYQGTTSTGKITEVIGINEDLSGRCIVIVEDIVDTGVTMSHLLDWLKAQAVKSVEVCSLIVKPEKLKVKIDIKYAGMEIPDTFILGYGLDYNNKGRNYKDIYKLKV